MDCLKILIVDDNASFRHVFAEILQDYFPSITIEEANDGFQTLKKTERFFPDIVIMDINLPGESGLRITREIKDRLPKTQVYILTSFDFPEYREEARRAGASGFIVKGNSNIEAFSGFIRETLDERKCLTEPYPS